MDNIKSEKAKELLKRSFDGGHISMDNAIAAIETAESDMIWKALSDKENTEAAIISLIMNDAYACTFQTLGQYRTALAKEVRKLFK